MKTLRNLLLVVSALLMCSVVALDHYRLNLAFYNFDVANYYNNEQLDRIIEQGAAQHYATVAQEIASIQTKRMDFLLETLTATTATLNETRAHAERLQAALDSSAKQLIEMIDTNAELQSQIDKSSIEIQNLRDKLEEVKQELEAKKKELEDAKKPVDPPAV